VLVLAVGAHPDDETFGGGLLARYASEGNEVHILLTTRGEGGFPGEPPLCERSELGATREAEARESGRILGARDVRFLPFRDPDLIRGRLQPIAASLDEFSGAIAAEIAASRPDVVVTHGSGGDYGHPQHTYTHRAVFAALARLLPWRARDVWTWCGLPRPRARAEHQPRRSRRPGARHHALARAEGRSPRGLSHAVPDTDAKLTDTDARRRGRNDRELPALAAG
jgi:LmbE family N-acetylglucosaminyl deacetylase